MVGYPVLLRLAGWRCVVIGGGMVAKRKVADLLNAEAHVIIVAPQLDPVFSDWEVAGLIEVRREMYAPGVLADLKPRLVFAATDSAEVNLLVAEEADTLDILANVANEPAVSSFFNMAVVRRGDITVAISTGGHSPALASHLKEEIGQVVGDEYDLLSQWMGSEREHIQQMIADQSKRADVWRKILASPLLSLMRSGQIEVAHQEFLELINEAVNS